MALLKCVSHSHFHNEYLFFNRTNPIHRQVQASVPIPEKEDPGINSIYRELPPNRRDGPELQQSGCRSGRHYAGPLRLGLHACDWSRFEKDGRKPSVMAAINARL